MPDGWPFSGDRPAHSIWHFSNVNALITDLGKVTASEGVQKPEVTKVQIVSGADNVLAIVKNSLTPVSRSDRGICFDRRARGFYAFRAKPTPHSVSSFDWTLTGGDDQPGYG